MRSLHVQKVSLYYKRKNNLLLLFKYEWNCTQVFDICIHAILHITFQFLTYNAIILINEISTCVIFCVYLFVHVFIRWRSLIETRTSGSTNSFAVMIWHTKYKLVFVAHVLLMVDLKLIKGHMFQTFGSPREIDMSCTKLFSVENMLINCWDH